MQYACRQGKSRCGVLMGPSNEPDLLSYIYPPSHRWARTLFPKPFSILASFTRRYSHSKIDSSGGESPLPVLFIVGSRQCQDFNGTL